MAATRELSVRVGNREYRLRALASRLEEPDPMFGELWPVGVALAQWMATYDAAGKRVLEAGCGLALPSLVLKSRGIDVTAFDRHPEAGEFLEANARANGLAPIPFKLGDWQSADLGRFDLVIGADLLYEPDHPAQVAAFLARHVAPGGEIIIADPGRRQLGKFRKAMAAQGRAYRETPIAPRGHFLRFA